MRYLAGKMIVFPAVSSQQANFVIKIVWTADKLYTFHVVSVLLYCSVTSFFAQSPSAFPFSPFIFVPITVSASLSLSLLSLHPHFCPCLSSPDRTSSRPPPWHSS